MADGSELARLERHMHAVALLQLETYDHLVPYDLVLDRVWRKRFSVVHRYRVEGELGDETFFAKLPLEVAGPSESDHVRLIALRPRVSRESLQRAALRDLATAVESAGPRQLGAVRLPPGTDDQVVVMTAARGAPLRELVMREVRWRRQHQDLDDIFERAGALLNVFHEHVDHPDAPEALVDREEIVARALELVAHLTRITSAGQPLADIGPRLVAAVETHLPERLVTRTRFGDFGLTNVLLDEDGIVTAIDTLGAVRTPPLHDATYFVMAVTSLRPHLVSRGRSIPRERIDGWLRSFWSGYLGDQPIPRGAVELWFSLRLLERWAAKSKRRMSRATRVSTGGALDRPMLALTNRSLRVAEGSEPQHASSTPSGRRDTELGVRYCTRPMTITLPTNPCQDHDYTTSVTPLVTPSAFA